MTTTTKKKSSVTKADLVEALGYAHKELTRIYNGPINEVVSIGQWGRLRRMEFLINGKKWKDMQGMGPVHEGDWYDVNELDHKE